MSSLATLSGVSEGGASWGALPAEVDAKGIGATYEDGILEVAVPKAKEAKASKVQIKTKVA